MMLSSSSSSSGLGHYRCPLCKNQFVGALELARHLEWVHCIEKCILCGKEFQGRQNILFHLEERHLPNTESSSDLFACPLCDKKCEFSSTMVKHVQVS